MLLAVFAVGLAAAVFHWPEVHEFIEANRDRIRFVSLVISPALAILGFVWGILDKAQLVDLGKELGKAEEAADEAKREANAAKKAVDAKEDRIRSLEHDLTTIADSSRLWKLRKNEPFPEYRGWKYDPNGAKIVTFGLFKGGVGKTHLAANFAAYVSERQQKPVLLVDLDYQGSLSAMMSLAAGLEPTDSLVDNLFSASADLATLSASKIQLARQGELTALNRGLGLSRAWLVPASYTLAEIESRLLVEKVMKDPTSLDERYRLAHLLLHPHVRREFAAIILDTPPRMTLGTVNALVASHFYVVPAMLDRVSSEAVAPFLTQVEGLKRDLELDLRLAAIAPTMTRQAEMSSSEKRYLQQIEATAEEIVGKPGSTLALNVPRRAQITNEEDLGYFLSDDNGPLSRFYNPVFDEIWRRMHNPAPESVY
jgi:chromosome partitioning protein